MDYRAMLVAICIVGVSACDNGGGSADSAGPSAPTVYRLSDFGSQNRFYSEGDVLRYSLSGDGDFDGIERVVSLRSPYATPNASRGTTRITTTRSCSDYAPASCTAEQEVGDYDQVIDGTLRLIAERVGTSDEYAAGGDDFDSDILPVEVESPLSVGLQWSFDQVLVHRTDPDLRERYSGSFSVTGIQDVVTSFGTFESYAVSYTTARDRFNATGPEGCNSDEEASGTLYVYPAVGIIKQIEQSRTISCTGELSPTANTTATLSFTNVM